MIRSLLIAIASGCLLLPTAAHAAEVGDQNASAPPPPATEPVPDHTIDQYRSPVDALNERMIGTASRSVRYDWRRSKIGVVVMGSELLERNNFGSTRLGVLVRHPFGSLMGEFGVTRAWTWSTDSTDKLALTPYRQFARPSRFEFDLNVGYPIAEGVVTSVPSWVPPAELVFSANAGLRYLFYPGSTTGLNFQDTLLALSDPRLTTHELERLEDRRLPGMQIDPARYGVLAGLSLDIYFQPGALISPRVLVAVPLLTPVNGTGLGFWYELTLGLGWTF
ncbi:MAG: hypothetical protein IRZ16_20950 [Myxococcaceae bacterium]|nr:hypothetical protein [Myxococcaceae bacterium]